jgi:hypothetical protein
MQMTPCCWLRKKPCYSTIDGTETLRCYEMEIYVEKTKVMRISRQPSAIQIMISQTQTENVEYTNYLGSTATNYP